MLGWIKKKRPFSSDPNFSPSDSFSKSEALFRKVFLVAVLLIAMAALAWVFVPFQVMVWDGGFELTVNVSSKTEPLRSVIYAVCIQREEAQWVLEHPSHLEVKGRSVPIDPWDGKPFSVFVPLSGSTSSGGRELSRRQWKYLVVRGNLQDGRQVATVAEIPDCRESQELSVSFP